MRTKKVFPVGESSHRLSVPVGESSRRPRGQVSHGPAASKVDTKKTGKKVPRGMKMPRGKKVPRGMKVTRGKKVVKELRDGENYLTPAAVADIVRRLNSGEEALFPNIHNADVYSKHPKDLVEEFVRAVWINGHEDEVSIWLFRGEIVCCRAVGENGRWYQEGGAKSILDAEGKTIEWASRKQFSYRINCTSTNQRGESTGWVMAEFSLTNQKEGTLLISVLYQSNRCYPETPTADNSSPETPLIEQGHNEAEEEDGETVDASLGFPGAFSDTDPASITSLLVQAAEKAPGCRESCKMARKIDEFVVVKKRCLRLIDELRLDGSIISNKLYELEVLLQSVAVDKKLTPEACANIVSHGKHLSAIIVSATLDEYVKRTGQALNAFEGIIGVNVYDQVLETASQVIDVSLVVRDSAGKKYERVLYQAPAEDLSIVQGAENEYPIPANTPAASSSGLKRKADQDHPEGPPSTRGKRADTDTDGQKETNPVSFSENDPMPAGGDCVTDLAYSVIIGEPQVQPEQKGHAEIDQDGSGPCNGLYEINGLLYSEDPMHARGDDGGDLSYGVTTGDPQVQPEQQGLVELVAEGGSGPGNALAGGASGGDLGWEWRTAVIRGKDNLDNTGGLPVRLDSRIGEPAWAHSAPGAVTEVDAGQGSCTGPDCPEETEHQLSPDNDLTAVGDPGELMEDFPGQFEAEKYMQRPIDLDVGWHWVSATEAEPEQLAEGEITFEELTGGRSANELLGPSHGDMSGAGDVVELV